MAAADAALHSWVPGERRAATGQTSNQFGRRPQLQSVAQSVRPELNWSPEGGRERRRRRDNHFSGTAGGQTGWNPADNVSTDSANRYLPSEM